MAILLAIIEYTSSRHPDLADYARARLVRLWVKHMLEREKLVVYEGPAHPFVKVLQYSFRGHRIYHFVGRTVRARHRMHATRVRRVRAAAMKIN